jgi:UDP-N-acetylmuramyl pentapeptide phosphotransferase/UDP-N-acetylglucosamine-1-phosphate transferase
MVETGRLQAMGKHTAFNLYTVHSTCTLCIQLVHVRLTVGGAAAAVVVAVAALVRAALRRARRRAGVGHHAARHALHHHRLHRALAQGLKIHSVVHSIYTSGQFLAGVAALRQTNVRSKLGIRPRSSMYAQSV